MTKKNRSNEPELETGSGPDRESAADQSVSEETLRELARAAEQDAADDGLAQEVEKLATELEQKKKEAEEVSDKYRRTYADFENYRKRMQRDQAEFGAKVPSQ